MRETENNDPIMVVLSRETATILVEIFAHIGGAPEGPRKRVDMLSRHLQSHGVSGNKGLILSKEKQNPGVIYLADAPVQQPLYYLGHPVL
jgi:hypothetical protein